MSVQRGLDRSSGGLVMRIGEKAAFSWIDKTARCEKEIRPKICYVQNREGKEKVLLHLFIYFTLFNH